MTPNKAITMAESWTRDMKEDASHQPLPFFEMVRALLDHIAQQGKDIQELTLACQLLLRENKRIRDELPGSKAVGPSVDPGRRRKSRRVA
jgi:hypothetical protein